MEDEDTSIITWISDNLIMLVCLVVVFWILKRCCHDLRRRGFARLLNYDYQHPNAKLEELKKDIFNTLDSVVSHDPELRKENAFKILEIGVGSGTNLAHYPDGTRLVVVDPNPYFRAYYDANRKKFPKIHSEDIIVSTGEEMDMVPDNSVDVVVTTLVLCSVQNVEKVYQQILRVLVPGGKYYFFEHIKEFDTERHATRLKVQNFLEAIGIWSFIFDGCSLNQDMLGTIRQAGFAKVQAQRFYSPIDHFVFQLMKPSLRGVAVK